MCVVGGDLMKCTYRCLYTNAHRNVFLRCVFVGMNVEVRRRLYVDVAT